MVVPERRARALTRIDRKEIAEKKYVGHYVWESNYFDTFGLVESVKNKHNDVILEVSSIFSVTRKKNGETQVNKRLNSKKGNWYADRVILLTDKDVGQLLDTSN
jgi:hypothetical protein